MNWNLFFATITWSLTVVSFLIGVWAAFWLDGEDSDRPIKYYWRIFGVAFGALTLCIALIAGMGWHPHK